LEGRVFRLRLSTAIMTGTLDKEKEREALFLSK
jgi:hypothetical protein